MFAWYGISDKNAANSWIFPSLVIFKYLNNYLNFFNVILISLVTQSVKNLPLMKGTSVRSLDQEIPLEKERATHSSILAWRIPRTEEPGGLQSTGLQSRTRLCMSD